MGTSRIRRVLLAVTAATLASSGIAALPATPAAAAPGDPLLTIGDVSIVEGNVLTQVALVAVTLSKAAATDVTAQVAVTPGTASVPSDYVPLGPAALGSVTIRAGAVATYLRVKVIGDAVPEPDEALTVSLANASGADLGDAAGDVTIVDDDTAPAVGLSLGEAAVDEGDAKTRAAKVPFTLSSPAVTDVYITVTRVGGTATAAVDDKLPASKTYRVAAGRRTGVISVVVASDVLAEGDEVVDVQVTSPDVTIADGTATVTIRSETTDAGPVVASAPAGDAFYTPPVLSAGPPGELVWSRLHSAPAGGTTYLVLYRSTGQRGRPIVVSGTVSIPTLPPPPGGYDAVGWANGTTGMTDGCAPSKLGQGPHGLSNLLAAGYVVVSTDFEGLGTPGPHAYLQARSEAQTLLDAVRVARELGAPLSGRVVVYGGSRGGHAAVAAADRAPGYATDLAVLGAIGLGAGVVAPDDAVIDAAILSPYRVYVATILRGAQQVYGPSSPGMSDLLNHYLTPTGIASLPNADACPVAYSYYGSISASTIFKFGRGAVPTAAVPLRQAITVGDGGTDVPILLMSGLSDLQVPPAMIDHWHAWACATNPTIEKRWYAGGHYPVPWSEIEAWISNRFDGVPASTSCPP